MPELELLMIIQIGLASIRIIISGCWLEWALLCPNPTDLILINISITIRQMSSLTPAIIALIATLAALAFYADSNYNQTLQIFNQWKAQHGLSYSTQLENEYRLKIFEANLQTINDHNSRLGKSYTMGVNQFTGLTKQEFMQTYLSTFSYQPYDQIVESNTPSVKLNVDWVASGAVRPVRNQGQCIADYAFSAIGGIEGIAAIFYKLNLEFSPQEIIDCWNGDGCKGGSMEGAYSFIKSRGSNIQSAYPYTGVQSSCPGTAGFFKIAGYVNMYSCNDLDNALAGRPISVAVDGSNFSSYRSGAFDDCGRNVNLGVLLVGGNDLFYRIKLSWGTSFGQSGYMRLIKQSNVCGICQLASYPTPT